jgi:hypothetical protein
MVLDHPQQASLILVNLIEKGVKFIQTHHITGYMGDIVRHLDFVVIIIISQDSR